MKYKIDSTTLYNNAEKLIECYPVLTNFNITIEEEERTSRYTKILDQNGELIYQAQYKRVPVVYIIIDTLEQLDELIKAIGMEIIISKDVGINKIEIYDGYRE